MTSPAYLPRSQNGQLILPGREVFVLNDVIYGKQTVAPSEVTGGTLSGTPPFAYLRVATTATQFNVATVSLPAVNTTDWKWIRFTLDLTIPANGPPTPTGSMDLAGTGTIGATWNHAARAINSRAAGETALACNTYAHRQLETGRVLRKRASLLIIPAQKIVAALEDDDIILNAGVFPGFTGGSVTPKLNVQTPSAAATYLDLRRITLTAGR